MTSDQFVSLPEREQTAYHEAAHAVMHCLTGVPFREVSIVKTERSEGHVGWDVPEGFCHSGTRQTVRCLLCLVAGAAAGETVGQTHDSARTDHENAYLLAKHLTGDFGKAKDFVDAMHESAKVILEDLGYSPAVEALAKKLLEVQSFTMAEVAGLLEERNLLHRKHLAR